MIDVDARRRLPSDTLSILDGLVELTNGAPGHRVTRAVLARSVGRPEPEVAEALTLLSEGVRRVYAFEWDAEGAPTEVSLVFVPQGNAYGAFWALYEPIDARPDGWAARSAMEAWQGYWTSLPHIDFDTGLQELAAEGWAHQSPADQDLWRLTPTGANLGGTRLALPR
jgi:hypothetical protein